MLFDNCLKTYKNQTVKNIVMVLLFLYQNQTLAQNTLNSLTTKININYNSKPIIKGEKFVSSNSDTISFETIKFYLSSFEIKHKDNTVLKEKDSYHLVDFRKPETLIFKLGSITTNEIESVQFNVGVDSTASVSGAMEGDLDPVNAMYWAWQSGFINCKIEGTSSSCNTRNNKFQFHIGGYLKPNYAIRVVNLDFDKNNSKLLTINVDLEKLFSNIKLNETNTIMIPGEKAMKIADLFEKTFSVE